MPLASTQPALRRAALAACATFLLALPLAGFPLKDVSGRTALGFRPTWVVLPVVTAFVAHLVWNLAPIRSRPSAVGPLLPATWRPRASPRWHAAVGTLALTLAAAFPLTPLASRYGVDLATTFLIYVMLGWGLNIVVGLAGLLDLGYVAFYAAGAYTSAILATRLGVGFWLALPLSGLCAAALGVVLGFPVLRLKGDYLAIVTLGFGEIIRIVLVNWAALTGGPNGIAGIPAPSFFGAAFLPGHPSGTTTFAELAGVPFSPMQKVRWLYYIILVLALATLALTVRLRRLPVGRAWEALREDEIACVALGLDPTAVKLSAFALGAGLGGVAGCFFAARQGFVSPESFTFAESAVILAIVILGGAGSQLGIVVAAAVLVGLPEVGRSFAEFRMLFFGMAMVVLMTWRPGGVLSRRSPTVRVDVAKWRLARAERSA